MSNAFSKEPDGNQIYDDIGDRPVSPHRNLVTPEGFAQIEAEVERYRVDLAKAEEARDRAAIGAASRELRYWAARRANAEVVHPEPGVDQVRFGHKVTIQHADGRKLTYRIVGEDEADPAKGTLAYIAPLAQALMGKSVGDVAAAAHGEVEIIAID